jgi:hypothetical protein
MEVRWVPEPVWHFGEDETSCPGFSQGDIHLTFPIVLILLGNNMKSNTHTHHLNNTASVLISEVFVALSSFIKHKSEILAADKVGKPIYDSIHVSFHSEFHANFCDTFHTITLLPFSLTCVCRSCSCCCSCSC